MTLSTDSRRRVSDRLKGVKVPAWAYLAFGVILGIVIERVLL